MYFRNAHSAPEAVTATRLNELSLSTVEYLVTSNYSGRSLLSITAVATQLHKLTVHCRRDLLDSDVLSTLAKRCAQLQVLDISNENVTDQDVHEFVRCCPLLTSLSIVYSQITDEGVEYIVKNLQLRVLGLQHSILLTARTITHITQYCTTALEELRLDSKLQC